MTKPAARRVGHSAARLHRATGIFASFAAILVSSSILLEPVFAAGNGPANSGANSNGNGSGNSGGNGEGNAGNNGKGNPGGGGKSGNNGRAAANAPTEVAEPASALGLREAGVIHPLAEAYAAAERQFGGEVIDATLEQENASAWRYDLRVVTGDGRVRTLSLDAATLALITVDGVPVE